MKFQIETSYDRKSMTAMVRGIRKVLRKKQTRRTHILGIVAIVLGILLLIGSETFEFRSALTLFAVLIISFVLIFKDQINAYFTLKRGLPGMDKAVAMFHEDGYHSATAIGESDFYYNTVQSFIESGDYLIFAFSPSHGQVYDKRNISGGSLEEFVKFIENKTGKQLTKI